MTVKKRGLGGGRGLNALLSTVKQEQEVVTALQEGKAPVDGQLRNIPIEFMQRGRYQPRRDFEPAALQELADSIKAQGIMQPIVVRATGENKYEIIAGERRWRAAQMVGLEAIPAIIRDITDEMAIAMALIENIQRENLNPMEEATALQRFAEEFEFTHQQLADAVGKSRATVSNLLRLVTLHSEVKSLLEHGDIEMGHAKAILGLPVEMQAAAGHEVVSKNLTVRHTEAMVRNLLAKKDQVVEAPKTLDPNVRKLQESIAEKLGAPVHIDYNVKGKGKLVISYNSLDELDGILAHIR